MARKPLIKNLENTRLLKDYASWVYCTKCNKTVAYLCYVTYNAVNFNYTCNCGNCGSLHIEFEKLNDIKTSTTNLSLIKNRLCCPEDQSPLITIFDNNLVNYKCEIVCNTCHNKFLHEKT